MTLTKNADIDKYKYSGYGIGFNREGTFHLLMDFVETASFLEKVFFREELERTFREEILCTCW